MAWLDNIVDYWKMDEASGDALGASASITLAAANTPGAATGLVYATARQFDVASLRYFSHADSAALSFGDVDCTIAAFVKMASKPGSNATIVSKGTAADGEYYLIWNSSLDRFQVQFYGTTGFGSAQSTNANNFGSPSTGTWYLVLAWHDSVANTVNIQVNNGTVDSDPHTTGILDGAGDFEVGSGYSHPGQYWDGLIGPVVIWKRVLTPTERTNLWNSGAGMTYAAMGGGGDTTPPTLSARTVPTGGTTLTATLSESGCVPASGSGGFTLAGTSATVASWAISGTTLTLTLSGTVYSGQTVTLTYSRASTTDDIADAAGNFLADFSAAAVTNNSTQTQPLTAGTASLVSSGPGGIAMTATDATFGTPAYTYQWQRNAGGGSYSNLANGGGVAGATTRSLTDGSAVAGNLYGYRCVFTDSAGTPATVTSNAITAQVYTGGALTGSAGYSRGRLVNS